jgi:hypothetical protein
VTARRIADLTPAEARAELVAVLRRLGLGRDDIARLLVMAEEAYSAPARPV